MPKSRQAHSHNIPQQTTYNLFEAIIPDFNRTPCLLPQEEVTNRSRISFLSPCPLLGPLGATNEHIQPPCISKGEKCCWIHCILWWQNSQRYQCSEYSCLFYYIFRYSDAEIIIDMLIYKISSIYIYIIYLLNRYLLNIYLFICFFVCFLALSPEQT